MSELETSERQKNPFDRRRINVRLDARERRDAAKVVELDTDLRDSCAVLAPSNHLASQSRPLPRLSSKGQRRSNLHDREDRITKRHSLRLFVRSTLAPPDKELATELDAT